MADERKLRREAAGRILGTDKPLADQIDKLRGLTAAPELKPTLEGVRDRVGALESRRPRRPPCSSWTRRWRSGCRPARRRTSSR